MTLAPGMKLGPYGVLAQLGVGGMGEVYRAKDNRLDREVAIKVLPEHLANHPEALARFEREAKAVAALSHPNILAIHDFGSDHGVTYAVTELLQGETLRSRMARGALDWRKAVEVGVALADGLSAAHHKGITHRDLKPENIFLTSDGRVKILDFGLARWKPTVSTPGGSEAATEAGAVLGTVGYMSPEQVRGEWTAASSDIFSLGCVLYEMLSGKRAFARPTPAETMAAILNEDPPPVAGSGKHIPAELDRLLSRCLEKNPEERSQSARDLGFALKDILGGSGVSPLSAAFRKLRLHPAYWIAAAVILLAAAALLYLRASPGEAIDSLAVLPFVNVGADPDAEYLSDGITENLINSLSELPKLRVVPRSTVFRYKGREVDLQKVRRELNVRAVLTGRVIHRGDSLNIQSELVDVMADSQLWGRQYSRKFSDIITVQEEITKEVSEKLRLKPTGEEQKRLTRRYTENPEAHQLYLKGRYLWNRRTGETLTRAAHYFQQAIDKDPGYALAWAGLGDCYVVYSFYDVLSTKEALPRAKEAALKALEIDDTLAEAHEVLAFTKRFDWDFPGALAGFKRAIELNPSYASAHHRYGLTLAAMGRLDEGLTELKRAQDLDPLSPSINADAERGFYYARQYDQAAEQLQKILEMDPTFPSAHWFLGMVYEQEARYQEAIAEFQKFQSLSGGQPAATGALGHAYAVSGKESEAQKALLELKEVSKSRYVAPFDLAVVYIGLGDKNRAMEWLEKAYEDHSAWLGYVKVDPRFDRIRQDPRYQDLLRRMNLAP